MKKIICIVVTMLLFIVSASGCTFEPIDDQPSESSQKQQEGEAQATSSTMIAEADVQTKAEKTILTLYFANKEATKLVPEKRFIPKDQMQDLQMSAETAMKELFKGPISGNLVSPFPTGVEVPTVKVENGLAIVDITKNFVKKHPGGSTGEELTVYSIVNTLTGINGIKKVQFTIEGKKEPEFKGHLEFDKPFTVNPDIVAQQ